MIPFPGSAPGTRPNEKLPGMGVDREAAGIVMAARKPRICPLCQQPIRQREGWVSLHAVRHHLTCARKAGLVARPVGRPASPTGRGRGSPVVSFRVSDAEWAGLQSEAEAAGLDGPNELARQRTLKR